MPDDAFFACQTDGLACCAVKRQWNTGGSVRICGRDFLSYSRGGQRFSHRVNHAANVIKESDDPGAISSWCNPTCRSLVIRCNHWKSIVGGNHCGAVGIRLDAAICGFHLYSKAFEHCDSCLWGRIQIHGGKGNVIEHTFFPVPRSSQFYSMRRAVPGRNIIGSRWLLPGRSAFLKLPQAMVLENIKEIGRSFVG